MIVNDKPFTSIWYDAERHSLKAIDQRKLPFRFAIAEFTSAAEIIQAISNMTLRGAPVIGVAGAFATFFLINEFQDKSFDYSRFLKLSENIKSARPTAINLSFGVDFICRVVKPGLPFHEIRQAALNQAQILFQAEIDRCYKIGLHGVELIRKVYQDKKRTVNILTHCNAGWLACVDWGTALAPVYMAFNEGIPVHVWVDETRPRNQGARLTAWELSAHGVKHTLIADNAGGHLMQAGRVDMVITGTDCTSRNGDVANKIGTYLKALSAFDNGIPFYVALPSSSFDSSIETGQQIKIENRNEEELSLIEGMNDSELVEVRIYPSGSCALNPAFDVTPARLVSAFITEHGICKANQTSLEAIFQENH